ncbi:MAG TPA: carboxypeptidase-like regulatory domain-containing protein [Chitinophagaceae bacterium]|nr:carboxypeptidase-like regulatory domain-containing protein [Chitinophagaceae bacterium]
MNKAITILTIAALLNTACASCQRAKARKTDKGYISGKVMNTEGKPIANAQVYISSSVFFNSGVQTTTDANGHYRMKIPSINSLRAFARVLVTYNDKKYLVNLDPDYPQSFTSFDAVTCNFRWKLSGPVPGSSAPEDYYGGVLTLYGSSSNLPFPAGNLKAQGDIEFKFEPQGAMIDGSAGKTITVHAAPPNYSYIYDIPVGRYKVSATYKGQPLQIRDNSQGSSDEFGLSKIMDFVMEGSITNGGPFRMYLEFSK